MACCLPLVWSFLTFSLQDLAWAFSLAGYLNAVVYDSPHNLHI